MDTVLQKSTIDSIVSGALCHGCGICSVVCPNKAINLRRVGLGTFEPEIDHEKCNRCGKCFEICSGKTQWGSASLLGEVNGIWIGFASNADIRRNSASGGIVSAILLSLLESGKIDAAICCGPDHDNSPYPKSYVARNREDVFFCAKSIYGKTEIGSAIATAIADKNIRKIAVVGLPCQLASIKQAVEQSLCLKKLVTLTIGIMDGHNVYHRATELDIESREISVEEVKEYRYRASGWSPFYVQITSKKGSNFKQIWSDTIFAKIWDHFQFIPPRCLLCNDFTAEYSDIAVADAWLKEFQGNQEGYSIILAHTLIGRMLVEDLRRRDVLMVKENTKEVIAHSQYCQLDFKKRTVVARTKLMRKFQINNRKEPFTALTLEDWIEQWKIIHINNQSIKKQKVINHNYHVSSPTRRVLTFFQRLFPGCNFIKSKSVLTPEKILAMSNHYE